MSQLQTGTALEHLPFNRNFVSSLWPSPPSGADVTWNSVGTLAKPRGFMGAVLFGQQIFVVGGISAPCTPPGKIETTETFNIQTHQSVQHPKLNLPHWRSSMVTVRVGKGVGKGVYVIGGWGYPQVQCPVPPYSEGDMCPAWWKTCYKLTEVTHPMPGGDSWFWESQAVMPETQNWPFGAVGPGGKIYLMGGIGDNFLPTALEVSDMVQRFDPADGTWSQVKRLPTPRFGAAAATANHKIYVFGGCNTHFCQLGSVEEYDPVIDTWNTLTELGSEMPTLRSSPAAVTGSNGRIYVIGGWDQGGCNTTGAVEEFDPVAKTWRMMAPMPTPRGQAAAVATNDGRIFVLGGWQETSAAETVTIGAIEEGTLPIF